MSNFNDFLGMQAAKLNMTREEYTAYYLSESKPGPKPYHRGLDDDEIEDKKDQIKKQSDMDDNDSSAYKEMPGDKEAREKGEVKTSKHVKKYHELYGDKKDESVDEATFRPNSGTMSGGTYTLDNRKYKLKKDIEGVQIGNYTNIVLPKGTIIHNIPGGVFADHPSLKRYENGNNKYFNKPTFKGISIIRKEETIFSIDKNSKILESVVTEAKAYKLKASEFGGDTHSAAYNVKGETTWRVHSTYAIDQVSGENNPEERDVVFFEAMPINNDIYIKIGGINNLKRTNGSTYGNNFGTTIEEWKKDPKGIAKEASDFLTDATHLKWINKKARSEGQVIKWALKDDYSSVIEDLVNKSLGLSEEVVYKVNNQSIFSGIVQDFEDFVKEKKSLNEASRRKVHKAAKQGSYPAVIVVVQDGKVIHQEPVSTPDVAPATFNVMQEKYPKAILHLEDNTGKRLFSESVVNEKLTRGLKPLLTIGSTITKKDGEDALLDLSDKFDSIDDEYAGTIASWLDMAIELMQDGYSGDATKKLKQFNKACKDVLNGKEVGSAFESVTENRMLRKGQFRFGAKLQYGIEDVNESYGFYGTLLDQFGLDEVNELYLDGFSVLGTNYDFTDQAALYYLNSKAGRWVADQVVEKLIGPKNMSPYYGHLEEIFAEYAKKGQWKKWSKEYDQFAEEDNMEEGLMIRESRSDRDEYYRGLLEAEQTTNDQSPLGDDGMETGIKNKAKESGVPVELLRIIMRRGLAAWKTGHRPGATQAQWGYARVNSFLTKQPGTWGKADSDIAKKVRDGGHDKDL